MWDFVSGIHASRRAFSHPKNSDKLCFKLRGGCAEAPRLTRAAHHVVGGHSPDLYSLVGFGIPENVNSSTPHVGCLKYSTTTKMH